MCAAEGQRSPQEYVLRPSLSVKMAAVFASARF